LTRLSPAPSDWKSFVAAESVPGFFVTPSIIALNILVFMAMVVLGVPVISPTAEQLFAWGADFGPATVNLEWWRLFTSMFIHIGLIHLAINMWVLWDLGQLGEEMFGNWLFFVVYVLSGLGGSIASVCWNPTIVSAGASGAIFGIAGGLGAYSLLGGRLDIERLGLKEKLKSVGFFIAYNLYYGFTQSGIDNAGHLGGLVTGFVVVALLSRSLPAPEAPPRRNDYLVFSAVALSLLLGAEFGRYRVGNDLVGSYFGHFYVGNKFLAVGKLDKAIEKYNKALAAKPDFADAHHNLGVAYKNKELYDKAIEHFQVALELNPDFALVHLNLGLALWAVGRGEEATVEFEKAQQLDPSLELPELPPQVPHIPPQIPHIAPQVPLDAPQVFPVPPKPLPPPPPPEEPPKADKPKD
jgi:rhomboid protease GluP